MGPKGSHRNTAAIVGESEADIKAGRMAITAPVARALIGRELGDSVQVSKPTIAAVNGAAIAGGTGLALLCDFTLAV